MNLKATGLLRPDLIAGVKGISLVPSSIHSFKPVKRPRLHIASSSTSSGSQTDLAASAKKKIVQLSGAKHGLDKSPEEKQAITAVASELAELNRVDRLNMTGSRWKLVFTESTASSSGKVGPFIGRTEQEFPADQPGRYVNWLYIGPVTASLLADYEQSTSDRIDVRFLSLTVQAGPFKWTKEFKNQGTWDLLYIDKDMRVFTANRKNLFVLERMSA